MQILHSLAGIKKHKNKSTGLIAVQRLRSKDMLTLQ
jgi:hypothetical protein